MFFYEGYSCPVCDKPFSPNEDVVACPSCGLPHHRHCWASEGHCHLEHLHDTDEQWSREKSAKATVNNTEPVQKRSSDNLPYQICPRCHTRNPEFAEICTHCGYELCPENSWQSTQYSPKGSYGEYRPYRTEIPRVDPNEKFDNMQAEDVAAIVGNGADYYIPRFRQISGKGKNTHWNWAAFFFGPLWLLYRKMYSAGALLIFLQLLQSGMSVLLYNVMSISTNNASIEEIYKAVEIAINNPLYTYYLLSFSLLSVIMFVIKLALGLWGNRLYFLHCSSTIRRARNKTPDLTAGELSSLGGTTVAMVIIGYAAQYFITQILALFLL